MASSGRGARTPRSRSPRDSNTRFTATNPNTATATATANPTTTTATDAASKAVAQVSVDARLHAVFEQSRASGLSFNYSQSVRAPPSLSDPPGEQITAYLSKIQRGGHIQPFGCTLAVDESSFKVIAYSENASEMLDLSPHHSVPTLDRPPEPLTIGTDLRSLFDSSSSLTLERAISASDIIIRTVLNPLLICSRSGRPFYAIVHRNDVGKVIDLEPVLSEDLAASSTGVLRCQKLAVHAVSRLESLPCDIKLLCDAVVELVRELTGYDRVMVYKFHEDEHGEVVAESRRPDLEPYLGLHYPATDIPQASRVLFKHNRVRMIVDCHAAPVRIIQDKSLTQPLGLVGSTLRAPHGCHSQYMANMGSIASLVLAVIINSTVDEPFRAPSSSHTAPPRKLWGLVVCHHSSPRCIPSPLRFACEYLIQTFSMHLKWEHQLALETSEKHFLKTQSFLCDLLLRNSPTGIVTQSPNIMDLVKCDGAAMFYHGRYYPLGVAPTEAQIKDIIEWLPSRNDDSTGLFTDSLANAGYPGAAALGDAVCGAAIAYITTNYYLFWFRSHTAKEIKWGGAKHHPEDKDDGQRMHPRSSFKSFLEVVKSRSLPWENAETDAIHSLQLILRESCRQADEGVSNSRAIVKGGTDELNSLTREMVRLIETANVPIFGVDLTGRINGWNVKAAELTGLPVEDAVGKSLVHDLVFNESKEVVEKLLYRALRGEEDENVEIKLKTFGSEEQKNAIFVVVNACLSRDTMENITGVMFVGQDVTGQKVVMDKFIKIQGDYKAIVHSPSPLIPPIFASDENTCCSEWNTAMEKLTGWSSGEILGKMLVGEVFGSCCRLKGPDALTKFMVVIHNAIGGQDTDKFPFSFYDKKWKYVQALLTANTRRDMEGRITGAFCFLQIASPELQQALEIQRQQEKKWYARMKELAYIRQEIKNPLNGIRYTNSLLETTDLNDDQKNLLETSISCERQMCNIIKDADLQCIEDGSLTIEKSEFPVASVISAIVSQVTILLRERRLRLMRDIPEEIKETSAYGDQYRIQQALATFLVTMVRCAPSEDGWVEIQVKLTPKRSHDGTETTLFLFRFACPGEGLHPEMVQDMFHNSHWSTQEGLALSISRKMLKLMGGEVQYIRQSERCFFRTVIELPTSRNDHVEY